jgi:hypothetical protein
MIDRLEIIRIAVEADPGFDGGQNAMELLSNSIVGIAAIERFAALVAAHEREKVAKWMVERGYATGHGDTIEDLLTEIDWQAAEREREGCAKLCDLHVGIWIIPAGPAQCAAAIRRRGQQ